MKKSKLTSVVIMLLVILMSFIGCSSKPKIKEFPKSANAKQEITNLEVALENSRTQNVELLSPVSFKKARNSLEEAKDMLKDKDDKEDVLEEVALGQAYLDRARRRASENEGKVQDVLAAREAAISANARTLLPGALGNMDKKVKEEMAKVENEDDNKLKEKRSDFITGYLDLELAAIKKDHLGESKFLIDESIRNGARDLTPRTFATANKKYQEVDLYITQNRHDTAEIEARSADVLVEARQLEATTATARGLSASTPEETALRMQAQEERLTKTQGALASEKGSNVALTASNSEMAKQQKINAIYEEARRKFTPDEAEVYKQGSNLVIRLRAIEFPAAKAIIKEDNFELLKKVENVIEKFGTSKVLVEGHTDSTGGARLNQQLSNARAEAVKKYLEVNVEDDTTKFEARGYGYDRPLATNKTPEGRAQNRRVDVIIVPSQL